MTPRALHILRVCWGSHYKLDIIRITCIRATNADSRYAVAAAKSLKSCPTLCNPIDGSPSGSPIPGILQARTLEWVAISFSNAWKWKVKVKSVTQSCLTLSDPMDCSLPGSSVHGIFQARVLEWGAIAFSETPYIVSSNWPASLLTHSPWIRLDHLWVTVGWNYLHLYIIMGFPGDSVGKILPAMQEPWIWSLGQKDPLEEGVATHSSILVWRIPWTEET